MFLTSLLLTLCATAPPVRAVASDIVPRALAAEFTVNDSSLSINVSPVMAAVAPGDLAVAWQRSRDDTPAVVAGRRIGHAGVVGPEMVLSQTAILNAPSNFPSIAATPSGAWGDWIVVWESEGVDGHPDISGIQLDTQLSPLSAVFVVNDQVVDFQQRFPVVSADEMGDFAIAWLDGGHPAELYRSNIQGRRYRSIGLPQSSERTIASSEEGEPQLHRISSFPEGGFVATWTTTANFPDYDVFFRVYTREDIGPVVRAHAHSPYPQQYSDVATCSQGRFFIAWTAYGPDSEADGGVYGQWFDGSGAKLGRRLHINQHRMGLQNLPTVSMTPDCQAVVVWQSAEQDGDGQGIFGRIVDPNGLFVTSEFRVNESTQGDQGARALRTISVVADSENSFVAAWQSDPLGTSHWEIRARGFCWLRDSAESVCGNVSCVGDEVGSETSASIDASDALATLRSAVGIEACSLCRCDVDNSESVTTSDALKVLRTAVSLAFDLECPRCDIELPSAGQSE